MTLEQDYLYVSTKHFLFKKLNAERWFKCLTYNTNIKKGPFILVRALFYAAEPTEVTAEEVDQLLEYMKILKKQQLMNRIIHSCTASI